MLNENGDDIDISGIYEDDTPTFANIEEVERAADAENQSNEDEISDDGEFDFDDFADDEDVLEEFDNYDGDDFGDDE